MQGRLPPFLVLAGLGALCAVPVGAQPTALTIAPARNALAVPRSSPVAVTLSQGTPTGDLKVFSQQAGGRKTGVSTTVGNTLFFSPTTGFRPGETLTATFTPRTGSSAHVWQFTAAVSAGNGQFGGGSDLPVTAYPYGVVLLHLAVGDVNGDGLLDATIGETGTNPSSIIFLNGNGAQVGRRYLSASYTPRRFPMADTDGDGDLDFVNSLNNGAGAFTNVTNSGFMPASSGFGGIFLDLDADGDLDYAYQSQTVLYLARNNGTGSFSVTTAGIPLAGILELGAGDLDNDGDTDIVAYTSQNAGTLRPLFNDGQGEFTIGPSYAQPSASIPYVNSQVLLGDLDGDGDLDVVTPFGSASGLPAFLNDGQGRFTYSSPIAPGGATNVSLGDVDNDGDLDLLHNGSPLRIFLNNGTGNFTPGPSLPIDASGGALLADMNNDGALDIIAAQFGATPEPNTAQPGHLRILLNNFVTAVQSPSVTTFGVWPNPAAGDAALRVQLAAPVPAARARLQTLLGQLVREQDFTGSTTEFSTVNLASGLYLLSVSVPGQVPVVKRIAVQ